MERTCAAILEQLKALENLTDFPTLLSALKNCLPAERSAQIDVLLEAGEILNSRGQYQAAQNLFQQGFERAKACRTPGKQALALGLMGDILRAQGNYRGALRRLSEARATLGENPQTDRDISARLYILSGLNNMSLGDYDSARRDFYEAYQIYAQTEDVAGRAIAANRLGTIATMNAQYNEAENYLRESLKIAKQLGDRHAMAGALLNLGEIQRLQDKPEAARPLYYESSALFAALGMHRGMCIAENNLGHIHVQLKDFSTAKYHYTRAVECAKIADLIPDMLDTLAGLVFILVSREEYGQAAQCVAFILRHPAHLQETEQFLEPAQETIRQHARFEGELPPPEQLPRVVEEILSEIF